jgi:GGDEF domain-containing protein
MTKTDIKTYWSFRTKLSVIFIVIIFSFSVGAFFLAQRAAENTVKNKILKDFKLTILSLNQMIEKRVELLQEMIQLSVGDPVFRAQIGRTSQDDNDFGLGDDKGVSLNIITETHKVLASSDLIYFRKYQTLSIFNNQGILLFSKENPDLVSTSLTSMPIMDKLKSGIAVTTLWSSDREDLKSLGIFKKSTTQDSGKLYLILAQQLSVSGRVIGYVIAGEPIDKTLLSDLETMSRSFVGIRLDSGKWSYTEKSKIIISGQNNTLGNLIFINDEVFLAMTEKVESLGAGVTLFFMNSISKDLKSFNDNFAKNFIIFLVPISFMCLILSGWLARKMSAPLLKLVVEVQKVTEGNLAAKVDIVSSDEIGLLANSFNEMTVSLSATRIDPATGAYTEQYLNDTLAYEMLYARTYNNSITIIRLMIDRSELELLQNVVASLKSNHMQIKDVLARVSTNEFVILKNNISYVEILQWLEIFRADLGVIKFKEQSISINIGIAILNPYIMNVAGFRDAAKNAVFDAQKLGANQTVFSQGSLPKKV